MSYREIKPNGFLSNFVKCFWYYENTSTEVRYTILPDGYFDLIVEFENGVLKSAKLTGIWTKPKDIQTPKNVQFFAIRFKLLAIEYIFKKEIKSIIDAMEDISFSFWNIDTYKCDEFERFASDITNSLDAALRHLNVIDDRKLKLFEIVYQQKPKSVSELSSKVHWSSRQINRYFQSQFGISLKEFLSIVRCNSTYKEISKGNLSPNDSYFVQAHFIKEIKKYTNGTPKELSQNKNDRFLQLLRSKEK